MFNEMILVKYGEIILKGLNRPLFEKKLVHNIKDRLSDIPGTVVTRSQAAIYISAENSLDIDEITRRLQRVFGIVSITRAVKAEKELEKIQKTAAEYLKDTLNTIRTFKVETKRADKRFPYQSPEVSNLVGGYLLEQFPNLKVDVKNPDRIVQVEIRDMDAYIYCDKLVGEGGMPTGTNGRATLLLSGGIDSPVAGYMIAKRGVSIDAVHFYSYPYTSERAKDKVLDLAKQLASYTARLTVHIVPFTEIQLAIRNQCPEEQLTIIMRRIMMRIAEKIARQNKSQALITGESIGQVASQTIESLNVTNAVVEMPVFRPLIGMDKDEIIKIARRIETFETSILPYEDCCTVFTPKHPNTKPQLEKIIKSEQHLEMNELIERALEDVEDIRINQS